MARVLLCYGTSEGQTATIAERMGDARVSCALIGLTRTRGTRSSVRFAVVDRSAVLGPLIHALHRRRDRDGSADDADGESDRESAVGPRRPRWWIIAALSMTAVYHTRVRPWHRRWVTTPREVVGSLPGDEFVQEPASRVTHAIEIDAPPDEV
ncbi:MULTISPECIES: hypothetical protein [Natrialbaceae]|uniref:hypothetical protein n=1 Tax=Natrialbaceae TaxID=1644061 RepID=UPI00207C175E|nr:hypothetical protein [Natronococcus sp. CG52]